MNKENNYVKEFGLLLAWIGASCLLLAAFSVWFSIGDRNAPWADLKLDGQTLASYIAMWLGTSVAFAGSWVAIRIAQSANAAQKVSVELQIVANKQQDPAYQAVLHFVQNRNELLLEVLSIVPWCMCARDHHDFAILRAIDSKQLSGFEPEKSEFFDATWKVLTGEDREEIMSGDKELGEWLRRSIVHRYEAISPLVTYHFATLSSISGMSMSEHDIQKVRVSAVGNWMECGANLVYAVVAQKQQHVGCWKSHSKIIKMAGHLEELLSDPRLGEVEYINHLYKSVMTNSKVAAKTIRASMTYSDNAHIRNFLERRVARVNNLP